MDQFALQEHTIAAMPVVNHFLARLGLRALLEEYLPGRDARFKLSPAATIEVVVRNLVDHHEPVYALAAWARRYEPAQLGLTAGQVGLLNDDRVGRALARLFDADRASLLTRLLVGAVTEFDIDCSRLHTDTTSISFAGAYRDADGHPRGGKPTPAIDFGHSKDHRPDLKQLVWSLTVSADGAVPICHRVANGNTNDDLLHVPTWDRLVAMLGRTDFLYVADAKLCARDAMDHIHRNAGRFLTILPGGRKDDITFRDWLVTHQPDWAEAARGPARYPGGPDEVWWTTTPPAPSAEGYRIVWVKSTTKTSRDAEARRDRIERGLAALDDLNTRLASPRTRMKTPVTVEQAATTALQHTGATRWINFTVTQTVTETFKQEKRGRADASTRYRKTTRTHHHITATVREDIVDHDAASDGCYPLITNDHDLTNAELFAAYKWQPNLEKRHAQLKGTQLVAPVYLHDPARIEGLLCAHFIAMLVQALIERQTRTAMTRHGITELPVYSEDRSTPAPTASSILNAFTGLARHHLTDHNGQHIQTFQPLLTPLQKQILDLLDIPHTTYQN